MTPTLWLVLGISVLVVAGFFAVLRAQLRQNREIDRRIDYSKVKPWVDEEEDDDPWRKP